MAIIKYAIADDHKVFRQGLRYALADDHRLKLIGEAENGLVLMDLLEKQKADVILLDMRMPEMDGIEVTKAIQVKHPGTKILILTTYDDEHFIVHLMESGANGYLLKNSEPEEIKKAIHTVFENDYYFNDLVSNTLLKTVAKKSTTLVKPKKEVILTDRETEVLKLICQQLTTAEIASAIFLSPRTIEGIRTSLLEKTGAKNSVGLVIFALKNDIYTE